MIRRIAAFFCAIALLFSLSPVRAESSEEPARLRLVAAVFPAYDFARVIAGDAAEVTLLLPPGADAHSYEPTPQDMIAIQNADLFLYTGGESDTWLERVLASLGDDAPETFAMADCVTLLEEEHSQSMAPEHDHDHDEDGHEEMDEHVWTSPKNVQLIVRALREKLCALSPENAERFIQNEAAYQQKLQALDERFETIVAEGKRDLIVFGDRFPFRYLADDYGLRYYAAFAGCSAETEASFETVSFLAKKVDELGLPCVLTIEGAQHRIAETIVQNTAGKNQKVLTMDSMQSTTSKDVANGATYLSVMEKNLSVLKEALG